MKVYIGSDHRGYEVEKDVLEYLNSNGIDASAIDIAHHDTDDYTDFAFALGKRVLDSPDSLGILICGTGIGMSIAANKVKGIRAARCVDVNDAFYAKNHNDANVLCLGMENSFEKMCEIIDTYISTKRASESRHLNRVNKIIKYENGEYNEL